MRTISVKAKLVVALLAAMTAGLVDAKGEPGRLSCDARTIRVAQSNSPTFTGLSLQVADRARSRLAINRTYLVGPPCASAVTKVIGNQIWTGKALVVELVGSGAAIDRPYDRSVFPLIIETKTGPTIEGRTMTAAIRIHEDRSAGSSLGLFIGLWQLPGRSLLATFKSRGGASEPAHVLLSSSLRINSVGYFPNVDSNSGSVSLLQRFKGQARVTDLSFNTDGWLSAAFLTARSHP